MPRPMVCGLVQCLTSCSLQVESVGQMEQHLRDMPIDEKSRRLGIMRTLHTIMSYLVRLLSTARLELLLLELGQAKAEQVTDSLFLSQYVPKGKRDAISAIMASVRALVTQSCH